MFAIKYNKAKGYNIKMKTIIYRYFEISEQIKNISKLIIIGKDCLHRRSIFLKYYIYYL